MRSRIGRRASAIAALLCAAEASAMGLRLDETPERPEWPASVEAASADLRGLRADTAHFLAYQFLAVGTISLWPQRTTNYSHRIGFDRWLRNVTNPHWDSDSAFINYGLHPYWGASYYVRARERGLDRGEAFWYSVLLSSIFEFGAEAMVERVSIQDLVVTPVLGSLLGEHVFTPWREHLRSKEEPLSPLEQVAWVLTDPLGSINSAVDRMLGVKSEITLQPMLSNAVPGHGFADPAAARALRRDRVGWRLQMQIVW